MVEMIRMKRTFRTIEWQKLFKEINDELLAVELGLMRTSHNNVIMTEVVRGVVILGQWYSYF